LSQGAWGYGQGETIEETKNSLREAIELILDDRKADIILGLPEDAIQEKVLNTRSQQTSLRFAGEPGC
jgi:predicted RNase H-like HicB family nuclease